MRKLLAAMISIATIGTSHAGEVYVPSLRNEIYFNGNIEEGDLEKIVEAFYFTLLSHGEPTTLHFNSRGGDVAEGLKIAEFVREAWVTVRVSKTVAPTGTYRKVLPQKWDVLNGAKPDEPFFTENRWPQDSECYSICALILAASPTPEYLPYAGPSLGFHRPFINPDINSRLTPAQSKRLYEDVNAAFVQAALEYGLPSDFVDRVMRVSSSDILTLGYDDWEKIISGHVPWFEEYFRANCETLTEQEEIQLERYENDLIRDKAFRNEDRDSAPEEIKRIRSKRDA